MSTDWTTVGSRKLSTSKSSVQVITSLVSVIALSSSSQLSRPWNSREAQVIVHPSNHELRMACKSPSRQQCSSSSSRVAYLTSIWNTVRISEALARSTSLRPSMMPLLAMMPTLSSLQQIQSIIRCVMTFKLQSLESAMLMSDSSRYLVSTSQTSSRTPSRRLLFKIMRLILLLLKRTTSVSSCALQSAMQPIQWMSLSIKLRLKLMQTLIRMKRRWHPLKPILRIRLKLMRAWNLTLGWPMLSY